MDNEVGRRRDATCPSCAERPPELSASPLTVRTRGRRCAARSPVARVTTAAREGRSSAAGSSSTGAAASVALTFATGSRCAGSRTTDLERLSVSSLFHQNATCLARGKQLP